MTGGMKQEWERGWGTVTSLTSLVNDQRENGCRKVLKTPFNLRSHPSFILCGDPFSLKKGDRSRHYLHVEQIALRLLTSLKIRARFSTPFLYSLRKRHICFAPPSSAITPSFLPTTAAAAASVTAAVASIASVAFYCCCCCYFE